MQILEIVVILIAWEDSMERENPAQASTRQVQSNVSLVQCQGPPQLIKSSPQDVLIQLGPTALQ